MNPSSQPPYDSASDESLAQTPRAWVSNQSAISKHDFRWAHADFGTDATPAGVRRKCSRHASISLGLNIKLLIRFAACLTKKVRLNLFSCRSVSPNYLSNRSPPHIRCIRRLCRSPDFPDQRAETDTRRPEPKPAFKFARSEASS